LIYINQSLPNPKHLEIIARLTDVGCPICLNNMITNLNQLNKKYPGRVIAYYQGTDSTLKQSMGAHFAWKYLNIKTHFVSIPLKTYNPVCTVIDHSGMVQWLHIMKPSQPNHLQLNNLYFTRLSSLFSSLNSPIKYAKR